MRSLHTGSPDGKNNPVDLEVQINMLSDQLQLNQMPACGNLLTSKKKDVRQRIRCISALLQFKEKNFNIKGRYED